jgi:catechol 2,3-dioxygenase-like lactoylglutathione lyase family enzyme
MARVVHFELAADDPERAVKFYQQVFGWQIHKWDGPQDYWLATTGEQGEQLWDNFRRTVSDFLFNEWKSGRLMGLTTDEAYFVRCDRTTMTQNDIDNGRLICLIGVAPLRPAEFVIFRIGQKLLETRA